MRRRRGARARHLRAAAGPAAHAEDARRPERLQVVRRRAQDHGHARGHPRQVQVRRRPRPDPLPQPAQQPEDDGRVPGRRDDARDVCGAAASPARHPAVQRRRARARPLQLLPLAPRERLRAGPRQVPRADHRLPAGDPGDAGAALDARAALRRRRGRREGDQGARQPLRAVHARAHQGGDPPPRRPARQQQHRRGRHGSFGGGRHAPQRRGGLVPHRQRGARPRGGVVAPAARVHL